MRVPERHAFAHQVVGEIRGGGEAALGGGAHGVRLRAQSADDADHGAQAVEQRVRAVEQRPLVLLVVAVVGERLAFHKHEQGVQVADHASGLAAHQFGDVRVLLLRHDARAGAEGVRQRGEAPLRRRPKHQFLAPARQVDGGDAGGGAKLDGEVAVAHGVQSVGRGTHEAELGGGHVAVDGERGAGQGGAAQRADVDAAAAIAEPFPIAQRHLEPSEQMVRERDRLRDLQMREARHRRGRVRGGQVQQPGAEVRELAVDGVDLVAQPQARVGGDLIIARARRVQFLAGVSHERRQPRLDVHVNIFKGGVPRQLARFDFALDSGEAVQHARMFVLVEHADRSQHVGVGDGAADVVMV